MVSPLPLYRLALHPDIERPIGAVKQMHRYAEALTASFHPGWFPSRVATIGFKQWRMQEWFRAWPSGSAGLGRSCSPAQLISPNPQRSRSSMGPSEIPTAPF